MIAFMDRCLACNCVIELDFVPAYVGGFCTICDVHFFGLEPGYEPPYQDYEEDEYDPDNRDR